MLLLENTSEGERGRDESVCLGDVHVGERGREKERERERECERGAGHCGCGHGHSEVTAE